MVSLLNVFRLITVLSSQTASHQVDTLRQLREKYGRLDGTVLHSERGCQYTSYAFRRELVTNGLIQSLSGTAHCYDIARMESFFATLKKRTFSAEKPLKKLLTDITEVQCADGKLYVSQILDCFNGEIIALEMRDNMKKELCIDTVKQLREKYKQARRNCPSQRPWLSVHKECLPQGACN